MKAKPLQMFDFAMIASVLILGTLSVIFIYSSAFDSSGTMQDKLKTDYIKQIIWASGGLLSMVVLALLDYRKFKRYIPWLAAVTVVLLAVTLKFGRISHGARSWLSFGPINLQPAEFAKISFTLFLAWYLDKYRKHSDLKRFAIALLILVIPLGLILKQPDFGSAMVYIPIFIIVCFMADIPLRYLFIILLTGGLAVVLAVLPVWQEKIYKQPFFLVSILGNKRLFMIVVAATLMVALIGALGLLLFKKRYFYWIAYAFGIIFASLLLSVVARKFLQEYQVMRLIIFLDPYVEAKKSGWNIINSRIAIGSGQFTGKGFLLGTHSHYRYLPEQSTDFIFSILAEELGFIGCMIVFIAYFMILIRIVFVARNTTDYFGCLICTGFLAMFFFHFMVNVGMTMGIMPITGIPLPFVSYGGSAFVTNSIALGLVMSVRSRRLDFSATGYI